MNINHSSIIVFGHYKATLFPEMIYALLITFDYSIADNLKLGTVVLLKISLYLHS